MLYSENSGHQLLSIVTKTCVFQDVLFFSLHTVAAVGRI